jgi:hypothetical protein
MSRPRTKLGACFAITLMATLCLAGLTGGTAQAANDGRLQLERRLRDWDRDGMPNTWETNHGLNPHRANAKRDPDRDGLRNVAEYRQRTRPFVKDTDRDGLFDGSEVHRYSTDPKVADSDDDGIEDGYEDGDDNGVPNEGEDHDGEGFVGTIILFDGEDGHLMFESAVGWPVTALVSGDTKVRGTQECDGRGVGSPLVEGNDIVELQFASKPVKGVPVVTYMLVDCNGAND